jgi:uncharacterized protein YrrD
VGEIVDRSHSRSRRVGLNNRCDRPADSQASGWPHSSRKEEFVSSAEYAAGRAMTRALLRGADLIGLPVVDASTGDDVAEVRDVLFDAAQGKITGFTLRRPGFLGRRLKQTLSISYVLSVGTGAVMIETPDALFRLEDSSGDAVGNSDGTVAGDRVITESGRILGELKDVVVLGGQAPRVVGFEIGGGAAGDGLIPVGAATGISGSALIVPDEYEYRIKSDLTGLAAELALIDEGRT